MGLAAGAGEVFDKSKLAVVAGVPVVLSALLPEPLLAFCVLEPSPAVPAAIRRVGSEGAEAALAAGSAAALATSLAAALAAGAALAMVASDGVTDWLPAAGASVLPPPQPETTALDASRQARTRGIRGAGEAGDFIGGLAVRPGTTTPLGARLIVRRRSGAQAAGWTALVPNVAAGASAGGGGATGTRAIRLCAGWHGVCAQPTRSPAPRRAIEAR